ncbi:cyclin-D4-1-like [Silene latifolia]|uniref:cyclin-D4-1-like n=1 Tax=Silene latifolia TaxID=37657 RepID=UPI003D78AD51
MAPSFDYAMSSLFCSEDNTSIFDDVDDNYGSCTSVIEDEFEDNNQNFVKFLQSDECLSSLFDKEMQHFVGFDYLKRLRNGDLDLIARNEAVNWIEKVQSHYNFGPLCFYLSVNYLDRFLSTYELPKGKAWMMQLLAVACLSIAAKIDENDVPFSLDLQVCESKYIFEAKTIQRMELLVMSTLNWRMQSVTPFSFIDYFLYKLNCDQVPPPSLIFQAIQLIVSTIKGIDLLEYKPSEIAAAVAIAVSEETQTVQNPDTPFSTLFPEQLEKERVMKCVEMMHGMRLNNVCNGSSGITSTSTSTSTSSYMPQSPIGVLDVTCMSYKSDDTSSIDPSVSCANFTYKIPISASKRRRLNNDDDNNDDDNNRFKLES